MNVDANKGVSPAPSYSYLHKIYSIKKQLQIFDILQAIHPTHNERIWAVSFLKYAGYEIGEVLKILNEHAEWEDYSQSTTQYQVESIYKQPHRNSDNIVSKPRARKWQLTPAEEYRCKYYRSMEAHRINEEWMREADIPIYDACPELPFNPALLGDDGLSKDVARQWR